MGFGGFKQFIRVTALGLLLTVSISHASVRVHPRHHESTLDVAWKQYLLTFKGLKIQAGCYPARVHAKGSKILGTVILLHGYTACPQQYFEWSQILANRGYEVLMPLLPGHGRIQPGPAVDDISSLPDRKGWMEYDRFADQINTIARAISGVKVIVGLSVGGAVALDASNADPTLYDRRLIISPYLRSSNHLTVPNTGIHWVPVKQLLDFSISTGVGEDTPIGWGASCVDETKRGRQGICEFKLGNIAAITEFGRATLNSLRPLPQTQTQMVIVEQDPIANNEEQLKAFGKINSHDVSICMLPKGVNHSAISRFDSPDENKWWLPGLLQHATEFVVAGVPMAQGEKSVIKSYQQCNLL